MIVAALAGATLASVYWRKRRRRKPNCKTVAEDGGVLDGITYLEHVTGGADPEAKLPMVIAFHPLTATANGAPKFPGIKGIRVIRPQGLYVRGSGYSWFNTQASGDQAELTRNMRDTAKKILPFIQDIVLCRPTLGKPVVTGSSQGGHMAYLMATLGADDVKGAVAVSGWLAEDLWDKDMAPTIGIHGKQDTNVKYARTKEFAEEMGFPFYSFDAGHEVTSAMSNKWISEVKEMVL
jgi:phospholipase/carboxylesterase